MQRPVGVAILAVVNCFLGAYLFVGSMFGLLALWMGPLAVPFWGVIAFFLSLGYGLWKLRNWARWTQIVLSVIGPVGWLLFAIDEVRDSSDRTALFFGLGFAVPNVVVILYLLRPHVRRAFAASGFPPSELCNICAASPSSAVPSTLCRFPVRGEFLLMPRLACERVHDNGHANDTISRSRRR